MSAATLFSVPCRDCSSPAVAASIAEGGGILLQTCPHHLLATIETGCVCEGGRRYLFDLTRRRGGDAMLAALAAHAPPDEDDYPGYSAGYRR